MERVAVYCSFSGGGIIGWMSPRIADTFSAAEIGSSRRPDSGANERRSIALLSLHSSLCPSRPRVSHLRLCNGSEAGAGGGWTDSRHWNWRLSSKGDGTCAGSSGGHEESSSAGASPTRSGCGTAHPSGSRLGASEGPIFHAKPHQTRL